MGDKQPADAGSLLAQLVEQVLDRRAGMIANLDVPHPGERLEEGEPLKTQAVAERTAFPQQAGCAAWLGVEVCGRFAQKDNPPARLAERLQAGQGCCADSLKPGDDDQRVGHVPHGEPRPALDGGGIAERRQRGLTDIIKIDEAPQEPFAEIAEFPVHCFPYGQGVFAGPPVEPVAFDWVNHRRLRQGLAPGEDRVEPGKMILHVGVFPVPRRLIAECTRIIPLCLAVHGDPGQVGYPQGNAQRGLPIPLEFVLAEIEVPVGNAVEFRKHARTAVLPRRRLRLFRGGKFPPVAEHIDAGQLKGSVGAHRLPKGVGLTG